MSMSSKICPKDPNQAQIWVSLEIVVLEDWSLKGLYLRLFGPYFIFCFLEAYFGFESVVLPPNYSTV